MWHNAEWMVHPIRLELTREDLLVKLAIHYTTRGARLHHLRRPDYLLFIIIYEALCFDVAQRRMNGAPNETRTHSWRFTSQACEPLHHWGARLLHLRRPDYLLFKMYAKSSFLFMISLVEIGQSETRTESI